LYTVCFFCAKRGKNPDFFPLECLSFIGYQMAIPLFQSRFCFLNGFCSLSLPPVTATLDSLVYFRSVFLKFAFLASSFRSRFSVHLAAFFPAKIQGRLSPLPSGSFSRVFLKCGFFSSCCLLPPGQVDPLPGGRRLRQKFFSTVERFSSLVLGCASLHALLILSVFTFLFPAFWCFSAPRCVGILMPFVFAPLRRLP